MEGSAVAINSKRWKLPKFNVEKAGKFIAVQYNIKLVVKYAVTRRGKNNIHAQRHVRSSEHNKLVRVSPP
jgi:hypothetical protein